MVQSKRHHYIPEFLTKGFTNEEGCVYIYDKVLDKIHSNPRPPKSIFFEMDRNSIIVGDNKSTIAEDELYSVIDNNTSKAIDFLRSCNLDIDIKILQKNIYELQMFIINLYWRTPRADELLDKLYEQFFDELESQIATEGWRRQISRSAILNRTMKEIMNANINMHDNKIVEISAPSFVLSDFPTVYETHVSTLKDLDSINYMFPVSSSRAIIQVLKSEVVGNSNKIEVKHTYVYNVLSIDQCIRYVVSGDRRLLEKSVDLYKNQKASGSILIAKDYLFNKIKF